MTNPEPEVTLDVQDELAIAALRAVHDTWPAESHYVDDWHPDDRDLYRRSGWNSFDARTSAVLTQRQERIALAVLAVVEPLIRAGERIRMVSKLELKADALEAVCDLPDMDLFGEQARRQRDAADWVRYAARLIQETP
jgi:hypothetical protein